LRCNISPHVLAYISCPLCAEAPKISHKHPPLLFVLCAHGLIRTHSPCHAAYIYLFFSSRIFSLSLVNRDLVPPNRTKSTHSPE
jgi:hypothetical protein